MYKTKVLIYFSSTVEETVSTGCLFKTLFSPSIFWPKRMGEVMGAIYWSYSLINV